MKVMFELIAAILRTLLPKEEPPVPEPAPPEPAPPQDDDSSYFGRPVDANEETILRVLAEAILDLYNRTEEDNDPPEQMMYAFSMGVRVTLADPGLGRGIREALLLPKFKEGGCGTAMMDQAAAELRQMIEREH